MTMKGQDLPSIRSDSADSSAHNVEEGKVLHQLRENPGVIEVLRTSPVGQVEQEWVSGD